MATSCFKLLSFLLIAVHYSIVSGQASGNLTGYSQCAQSCIRKQNAYQLCETGNATTSNLCLCKDAEYLKAEAACVGRECGEGVLRQTGAITDQYCRDTQTPPVISVEDYFAAGTGSTQSNVSASTQNEESNGDQDDRDASSRNTIIGIVLGSVFGGLAVIIAALQLMATLKWIPERWKPLSWLWQRCCCGRQKAEPLPTKDGELPDQQ